MARYALRTLRGMLLALAVVGSMSAGTATASQHGLRSGVLSRRDVPAGFSQPVTKVYSHFPGTMTIRIAAKTRSCPLPRYYADLGWQQSLYEVIPFRTGTIPIYDVTLCDSAFSTSSMGHTAFQKDLPVIRALLRLPSVRAMHASFLPTPHVGDEAVGWSVRTAAGQCYWLRFRRGNAVIQISSPCGLAAEATVLRWAYIISSRLS